MAEIFRQVRQARENLAVEESVCVSRGQAAVWLGIRAEKLEEWGKQAKELNISFGPESATFSLNDSASSSGRDLWEEMLTSLERGRSEAYLTKRAYVKLARGLHRGLRSLSEDDADVIQLTLGVLWERLPLGIQKVLEEISPEIVRRSMGIAGSSV